MRTKYVGFDWHRVYVFDTQDGEHEVCMPDRVELMPDRSRELLDMSWGFTWGNNYATPSARQLALALLQHQFGDAYALANYEEFAVTVVSQMVDHRNHGPQLTWRMDFEALEMWQHRHLIAQARQKADAAIAEGRVRT